MVQFAQPLALLALGAVALPVLLYLLRRPRQVVRVGSLRPLDAARTPPALRWRPRWLLLLLRCALLAVIALLLADPWVRPPAPGKIAWLLRAPGSTLGPDEQAVWDRALREGWQPRVFAAGFGSREGVSPADPMADYWSLLAELDARVEPGSKVMVFAPTIARHFRGSRPVLSRLAVAWYPVGSDRDAPRSASGTTFALVAPPERRAVADRVRSAWVAAGAREDTVRPAWIIQLADGELSSAFQRQVELGATLVSEPQVKATPRRGSWFFRVAGERVLVLQRVTIDAGTVRMRDEMGEPLVTEVRRGQGRHWRLGFRLDAAWTDWTLRAAFPRWWAEQIAERDAADWPLDAAQVTPLVIPPDSSALPPMAPAPRGVAGWLWFLAVTLFALERGIAWRESRRLSA